MAFIAISIK